MKKVLEEISYRDYDKQVRVQLIKRFMDNERLTKSDIIKLYMPKAKSPLAEYKNKGTVNRLISEVKRDVWNAEQLQLTVVDKDPVTNERVFGIVAKEEEARFAVNSYYNHIKGVVRNTHRLKFTMKGRNLLNGIESERFEIPKVMEIEGK
jgi:hypothetical protein